jgi:hypothetical protein
MHQQINLYQPIFREERKLFSLKTVVWSLGIVAISLLLMWGVGARNVGGLAEAVAQFKQQLAAQERMAQAAGLMIDAQGNPADAQARVRTLSAQLAERTHALNLLRSGAAGQPKGFAPRMQALARQHTEGVWLDQLFFSSGPHSGSGGMMLRGRSLQPELVPRYLQTLTGEPELSGARFDQVTIDRRTSHEATRDARKGETEQPSATVRFSISNSAVAPLPEEQGT